MHHIRTSDDGGAAADAAGLPQRLMGAAVEAEPALSAPPGGAVPDAPGAGSGAFALAGSGVRVATNAWTVRLMAGCVCLVTPSEGTSRQCVARTPPTRVAHPGPCAPIRTSRRRGPPPAAGCLRSPPGQRSAASTRPSLVREGAATTQRGTRTPLRGVAQLTIFWNGNSLQGAHSRQGGTLCLKPGPHWARLPRSPRALSAAGGCMRHATSAKSNAGGVFSAGAAQSLR
jgi:hypothetical protein